MIKKNQIIVTDTRVDITVNTTNITQEQSIFLKKISTFRIKKTASYIKNIVFR